MAQGRFYSIGETVALVADEFPDLTLSSLRFLEREGLLHPHRTEGGHRLFGEQDVARIRLIKRLQARRHYPLETIRHMLVKLERAQDQEAEMAFLESLYAPLTYDPDFKPLTREQLAAATGLAASDIARLGEMGMLFPHTNGNGRCYYDEDDLKTAELVAREITLGAKLADFVPYAAAMRALMKEEFALLYKLIADQETVLERVRQLKETSDLVHSILRAKLARQMMMQARHSQPPDCSERGAPEKTTP